MPRPLVWPRFWTRCEKQNQDLDCSEPFSIRLLPFRVTCVVSGLLVVGNALWDEKRATHSSCANKSSRVDSGMVSMTALESQVRHCHNIAFLGKTKTVSGKCSTGNRPKRFLKTVLASKFPESIRKHNFILVPGWHYPSSNLSDCKFSFRSKFESDNRHFWKSSNESHLT